MKRLIAWILAALLCLGMFCGCEKGKGASTGSDLSWEEIQRELEKGTN